MTKNSCVLDEDLYPIAWRFNSEECSLSDNDKKKIVLFGKFKSEKIWDSFIPTKNLMEIDSTIFKQHEKTKLNFNNALESQSFFEKKIESSEFIWFFWGRMSAARVPKSIFLKSWDDFFYPSDESSILITPNTSKVIFSFEDNFFYGKLLYPTKAIEHDYSQN